ncbi:MAG: GAF domain-containing protein [Anaerolineales bacterium]|nr:GAF domain-containing protein [Anaerolineales bacterium]
MPVLLKMLKMESTKKRSTRKNIVREYQNEEQYRALFENVPIGIGLADTEGNLITFNDAMLKPGGYTREEVEALGNVAALYQDAGQRNEALRIFRQQGFLNQYPVQFKRKDGTPYDTLLSLTLIQINGKPFVQALVEDVTEKKRAEEALGIAEEKYRVLVEQSPLVMYMDQIDELATSFYISPQVEKILGYTPNEVLSDPKLWHRLIFPEDHKRAIDAVRKTIETGKAIEEYRMTHRDGRVIWIRDTSVLICDKEGKPQFVQGFMEDITERRFAEELVKHSESRFRAMIENGSDFISLLDTQGNLLWESPSASTLLGYGFQEFVGRNMFDLMHPDDVAWTQSQFAEVAKQAGNRQSGIFRLRHTDGTWRWIEAIATNMLDDSSVNAIVINYHDVTERKLHELELEAESMLAQALSETLELQPLLERLLEAARHAIPSADKGSILLVEPSGKLRIRALSGYTDLRLQGFEFASDSGYAAQTAREQRPLIFTKIRGQDELRYDGEIEDAKDIHSAITAPLMIRDRVIGVITLDSKQQDTFNETHLRLLVKFATSVALVLERTGLYEEAQRRLQELQALYESGLTLSNLFEPRAIGTAIVKILKQHMNWDYAVVRIRKGDSDDLETIGYGGGNLSQEQEQAEIERMNRLINKVGRGLTGWVIQHGVAVHSENLPADSRYIETNPSVLSGIYVPILSGDKVLGAIGVESESENTFDEHAKRFLSTLAAQVASALENARLFNDMDKRLNELSVLHQSSQNLLVSGFDADMTYASVHDAVKHVMPCDAFVIVLEDDAGGDYHAVYRYDKDERFPNARIPLGQGLSGQVISEGKTLLVADYHNEDNVQAVHFGKPEHVRSILAIPLMRGGKPFGMISTQSYQTNMYNESHRVVLETIAAQFASSIENARLFESTIQQLKRLTVLRDMDRVIASSFNLGVIFNLLLSHAIEQLKVDAANVLLFNSNTYQLEYLTGRGFHSNKITNTKLRLGESLAGKAAMERRFVAISDLSEHDVVLSTALREENFKSYYAYPLITKGELKGVLEVFSRSTLHVSQDWINFFETLAGQAAIAIDNVSLFENLERSNFELTLAYDKTIEGWSKALDLRDRETEGHTRRVTDLTLKLAQQFGLTRTEIINLRRGSLLHDIGKIGIPDHILLKPGKLTEDEWVVMRQHPQYAYDMLASVEYLRPALEIPYCHHEKWDGTGYPRGLKGEEIPISSRIFAVADVWDALTSHRPYRLAWSKEQALEFIKSQSGSHFDPKIVEAFLKVIE